MEELKVIENSLGHMSGTLTFIFLFFGGVIYLFRKNINIYIESKTLKQKPKDIKTLKYHSMFTIIDKVLHKIKTMDFTTYDNSDNIKTVLLRKLIEVKLLTIRKRFGELLEKDGLDTVNESKLKFMIAMMLSDLVNEYNKEVENIFVVEYGISAKDAAFLVASYESFRVYIVEAFTDELESIIMDNNYRNNFDRINTILYTVSMSLNIIPRDVVDTFNKINGRFKNYQNNGKFK